MIISRARRYIFVHIPKTGGTAMALALEARAAPDDLLIGDTPKARRRVGRLAGLPAAGRLWKHSMLADIEGLVPRAEMGEFFIFTLVRNPWDRMVSYYHWLREQSFAHPAVALARARDFRGFLHDPLTAATFRANPSVRYLQDGAGALHDPHFLRLEHLAADIAPLAAHLGYLPVVGRANSSRRDPDWRRYYDAADADHLAAICADDVARFGYRFDPD